MTSGTPLQAQLADHQLDRLETLLDAPEMQDALRLDEIQGYLCAALSGPQPMPEEDWLADTLGNEDALASEAGREAAGLRQSGQGDGGRCLGSRGPG